MNEILEVFKIGVGVIASFFLGCILVYTMARLITMAVLKTIDEHERNDGNGQQT